MSARSRAPRRLALAALAVAVGALAVAHSRRGAPAPEPRVIEVSIHSNDYPLSALLYVALEEKLFERHGVRAKLVESPAGKISIERMLRGEADMVMAADIPVVLSALERQPIVVVASLGEARGDHGVLARREQGIERAEDLRGKTIGVALGTSGDFYLRQLLISAGVPEASVRLVNGTPAQLEELLEARRVDAISTWQPMLETARRRGAAALVLLAPPRLQKLTWNLVTTRDYARLHPEAVERVLRALSDAQARHRADPDLWLASTAKHFELEHWGSAREGYRHQLSLDQSLLVQLEEEARWAIASGRAAADAALPNFLTVLDWSFLERVDRDAVRIVR
jgi:NitT/TauT family transport system substrate-binding protein